MTSMVALLVQHLVYWSVGALIVAETSFAWSYGAGVILTSYALFLWNAAGLRINSGGLRWTATVLLAAQLPVYWRRVNRMRFGHPRITWTTGFAASLLLFCLGVALIQAAALPLYHLDSVLNFGLKAKVLFHAGTFRIPYFYTRGVVHPVPDYPLLVPYVQASYYWLVNAVRDDQVRICHVIFGVAWGAMLYTEIRRRFGRGISLLLISLFLTMPGLYLDNETQWASGLSDIPLAFFWTGVFLSALGYLRDEKRSTLARMAIFSLGCLFTKPNGAVLVPAAWGLLYMHRRNSDILIGAGLLFLIFLPWILIQRTLPSDFTTPHLSLAGAPRAFYLPRLTAYGGECLRMLTDPRYWGLFWISMGLLLAVYVKPAFRSSYCMTLAMLQFALYSFILLIDPRDIRSLVEAQYPRWMLHLAPLVFIWVCGSLSLKEETG